MELAELETEVGVEVPGAARFAVIAAISAAAREFFLETRAWRVALGPLPWAPSVTPTLPGDTFLVEAVRVEIDGSSLRAGAFAMDNANGLTFADGVRGTEVTGEIAVAPTRDADELPERLGQEFRDAIVYGSLARLMRVPGAEWSNPPQAMYYQAVFEEAKDRAATRAEDGFTKKRTRVVRYGGY